MSQSEKAGNMKEVAQSAVIQEVQDFIKVQFQENPHFSYNDWTVMYDHSVMVKDLALQIAQSVPNVDIDVLAIGALLHDIGKTYKADPEVLAGQHQSFNLDISKSTLERLPLTESQLQKAEELVTFTSSSPEQGIIKDADAIALYLDKRLNMLFIEWAVANHLNSEIQRKIDKFSKIHNEAAKQLGHEAFEQMKKDWDAYIKEHASV